MRNLTSSGRIPPFLRDGLFMVRLALALDMLGWSIVLWEPYDLFKGSHGYDLMASWMSEDTWTYVCLAGFIASTAAMALSRRRIVRLGGTLVCGLFQGALFVSFAFGPHFTTGAVTHLCLGLVPAYWAAWRVATDV